MSAVAPSPPAKPLEEIAAFLLRHHPWWTAAARANALPYLNWFWRDARVGIVRDGPELLAIALARTVDDTERATREAYYHDEAGRYVWVDHIASVHPQGVKILLKIAMQRFGPREAFCGEVFKRHGELRMLPWKVVERMTADTTYELAEPARPTAAA